MATSLLWGESKKKEPEKERPWTKEGLEYIKACVENTLIGAVSQNFSASSGTFCSCCGCRAAGGNVGIKLQFVNDFVAPSVGEVHKELTPAPGYYITNAREDVECIELGEVKKKYLLLHFLRKDTE